jgi:hypothetical protein
MKSVPTAKVSRYEVVYKGRGGKLWDGLVPETV